MLIYCDGNIENFLYRYFSKNIFNIDIYRPLMSKILSILYFYCRKLYVTHGAKSQQASIRIHTQERNSKNAYLTAIQITQVTFENTFLSMEGHIQIF